MKYLPLDAKQQTNKQHIININAVYLKCTHHPLRGGGGELDAVLLTLLVKCKNLPGPFT